MFNDEEAPHVRKFEYWSVQSLDLRTIGYVWFRVENLIKKSRYKIKIYYRAEYCVERKLRENKPWTSDMFGRKHGDSMCGIIEVKGGSTEYLCPFNKYSKAYVLYKWSLRTLNRKRSSFPNLWCIACRRVRNSTENFRERERERAKGEYLLSWWWMVMTSFENRQRAIRN